MTPPQDFHALYCQLTGFDVPFTFSRSFEWERFGTQFTTEDLIVVVGHIKKLRREGKNCRDLKMRSLISGPSSMEFFAEDLAEARALARAPRQDGKAKALEAIGRPIPQTRLAEPAGAVIERLKMASMLKAWRESQT